MTYPIATKRGQEEHERAEKILGRKIEDSAKKLESMHRAHGGRVHHRKHDDEGDDDTASHNIHIVVNGKSPQDAGIAGPSPMPAPPPMGGPPPLPMGGPPGPGAMPPPPPMGAGAGPGPIAMRRGGAARRTAESSAASRTVGDKFHPDHHDESVPAKHAKGGRVGQLTNTSGGAGGGLGRLRKAGITKMEHE